MFQWMSLNGCYSMGVNRVNELLVLDQELQLQESIPFDIRINPFMTTGICLSAQCSERCSFWQNAMKSLGFLARLIAKIIARNAKFWKKC